MRLRVILPVISILAVLGCGTNNGMFTLSSGTYKLSSTSAAAPDNCNVGPQYQDGTSIQIAVSGTNAAFAFGSADASKNPVTTIDGNTLNSGSKTFDFDNNTLPQGQRFDCVETITETASGSLLADDQVQGALVYGSVMKSGTQCTTANLGYKAFPCSSTLGLIAKKQ